MGEVVPARRGGPEQRGHVQEHGSVDVRFPARAGVVALARQIARATCARWSSRDACESVLLVVSELLGNAVKAATGSTVSMRLSWTARRVRVEVTDDNPLRPVARLAGATEEGGRGLWLVDSVAVRWGSHPAQPGKCVWAEVALPT